MARFNTSEADVENLDKGGRPLPGKCQLLVTDIEEHDTHFSVTHEILAHEKPSEVGKVTYNSFNFDGKGVKRSLKFLVACGVITKQQAIDAGGELDVDIKDKCTHKVYFATLEKSEYNGKEKVRVEWDFHAIDSPAAEGYPFSSEFPPKFKKESKSKDAPKSRPSRVAPPKADSQKPESPARNDDIPF